MSLNVRTLALVPLLLLSGPARAGDEFGRGFNDEMGRIAAHAAAAVGTGVLAQILYGPPPPPVYAPPPPVYPAPVYYGPPVYVAPVYAYPYPVYAYPYPVRFYGGYPQRGYWGGGGYAPRYHGHDHHSHHGRH